jgi:hypothetical protein
MAKKGHFSPPFPKFRTLEKVKNINRPPYDIFVNHLKKQSNGSETNIPVFIGIDKW